MNIMIFPVFRNMVFFSEKVLEIVHSYICFSQFDFFFHLSTVILNSFA